VPAAQRALLADDNGRVPHIGDDDGGALTPIVERDPDDLRASLTIAGALADRPGLQIGDTPEDALWLLARQPPSTVRSRCARRLLPRFPRPAITSRDRQPAITCCSMAGRMGIRTAAMHMPTPCRWRSPSAAHRF